METTTKTLAAQALAKIAWDIKETRKERIKAAQALKRQVDRLLDVLEDDTEG